MEEKGKETASYRIEREFLDKVDAAELISRIIQAHRKPEGKTS